MKFLCLASCLFAICGDITFAAEPEKLPKVVIMGDSIRLSYTSTVVEALQGKAVVVSPSANGGDSAKILSNLDRWILQEKPDLVHFNAGIHDTKRFKETGEFQVSPVEYAANLEKIIKKIRDETDAVVIFATSTPIIDARAAELRKTRDYELLNASIEQYNDIARKIMKETQVPINDLFTLIANPKPPQTTEALILADGVHLTPSAQKILGIRVAEVIEKQLAN